MYPTHYTHRDCNTKHPSPEAARACAVEKAKRQEIFSVEDRSRNGVKVLVTRSKDGSTVDASCQCFGLKTRAHSVSNCPNRN